MPIHDWSCVGPGIFHDFHLSWVVELSKVLNNGGLPPDHFALIEPSIGLDAFEALCCGTQEPPADASEAELYALKRRSLAIRHVPDDHLVALVETITPGNKESLSGRAACRHRLVTALQHGVHLLILDVYLSLQRDQQGIHGAIWSDLGDSTYSAPEDKPLTLVAYSAGPVVSGFIEPVAVNDALPSMPLFLEANAHVLIPLEATYEAAFRHVPRWRRVLENTEA